MLSREEEFPTPDYADKLGYRGFVTTQSSAVIYNFYNEKDYALAEGPLGAWEGNQRIYKPDGQEPLSGVSSGVAYFYLNQDAIPFLQRGRVVFTPTGDLRYVSTAYESMAFIARSRSKAVGARKDVHGLIAQQVNIGPDTPTNLGDQRPDHSGLFTRSIQQLRAFYQTLNDIIK